MELFKGLLEGLELELFKGLLEGLEFELLTIALLVGRELALLDRGLDTWLRERWYEPLPDIEPSHMITSAFPSGDFSAACKSSCSLLSRGIHVLGPLRTLALFPLLFCSETSDSGLVVNLFTKLRLMSANPLRNLFDMRE